MFLFTRPVTGRDPIQYTIAAWLLGIGVVLWALTWAANRAFFGKKTYLRDPRGTLRARTRRRTDAHGIRAWSGRSSWSATTVGQMPALGTKLRVPLPRRALVARARLADPFTAAGRERPRLVLVAAPPGSARPPS